MNPAEVASLRAHAETLHSVAEAAIDHGLARGAPPPIDPGRFPDPLRAERACFATLVKVGGELRGCVGTIEPHRSLVEDVNENAWAAAFRDPRFPPLGAHERDAVECALSVLTPLEPVLFADENELLERIVPGVDGLLVESGTGRATFLPAVWAQFPEPADFWRALKHKAGLPDAALPPDLRVCRYRTETLKP